jgi:hypothetical protein
MKKTQKIIKYTIFTLAIILIIAAFPILNFQKEPNLNPLPSQYKKGVYHVHSIFSDGNGTIDDITRAADKAKLNFVILSDHGRPNIEAMNATDWLGKVLLIGGTEISTNNGHLASAGFKVPPYKYPLEPQEAIDAINRDNGFSFISHPFDDRIPWTNWDIENYTGLEVMNAYSNSKSDGMWRLMFFPLQYMFQPEYAILNALRYPDINFDKWDEINKTGKYYGIYALDAHGKLPLGHKRKFAFPSYLAMFHTMTIYARIQNELPKEPEAAASEIIAAIRDGRFFNCIEGIGSANGFDTYFTTTTNERFELGSSPPTTEGTLHIHLPFEFPTKVLIKKDGAQFKLYPPDYHKNLQLPITEKGVYRIEVFATDNKFDDLPWITTNPIFINTGQNLNVETAPTQTQTIATTPDFFTLEKNDSTTATINQETTETGEITYTLNYTLQKEETKRDYWAALAHRTPINLSNHEGLIFQTRSTTPARHWVEYRLRIDNQEAWYRHSFLTTPEWTTIHIPFKKFHRWAGKPLPHDLSKTTNLFFAINNQLTTPNTTNTLQIKTPGVY